MKELPFKMKQETEMEKYRAETFWTKEPETIEWIKSFKPDAIFFDVGANVGVYSLYAASLFPTMNIVAFEPMPENFKSLNNNILLNKFTNISPRDYAVGNFTRTVKLDIPQNVSGSTGSQVSHNGIDVIMVDIDNFCQGLSGLYYVKIDIDGQELEVINGMKNTLPHIKSILVEVSSESKDEITAILTSAGFTTTNRFNAMAPHSRERRAKEGIDAENIIFTR